ncbi:MAG: hypothetical protein K9K66_13560 [Desulfarculaceae bacterium]|nr:hypothetical protein [Desulfarculaceae bacterium]MCF8073991.1 hypothetical protein [Desulfarculaceae bacterium]MCF8102677.1 hypothetical protein [Desulfarculaceae bacterium]MCF8116082.1 hypothetical protein [Desulfarculaceae bacterium]
MKYKRLAIVLGMVAALALGLALAVPAQVAKPGDCQNKTLCAEKMRFGEQAFGRGDYASAKTYFKQAVQADPLSARAWAFYDLTIMYDVALQVQKAGQVKVSGAPVPGSAPAAPAGAAAAPPPAPKSSSPQPVLQIQDEGC